MKLQKLLLVLLSTLLLMSFSTDTTLKEGKYRTVGENDYVYGVIINKEVNEIKIYFYQDFKNPIKNWEKPYIGKIVKEKNNYFIENFESDRLPSKRDKKIAFKVKDGVIAFDSYKFLHNFLPEFVIYANKIKFELEMATTE